jgi:hypothetical protein
VNPRGKLNAIQTAAPSKSIIAVIFNSSLYYIFVDIGQLLLSTLVGFLNLKGFAKLLREGPGTVFEVMRNDASRNTTSWPITIVPNYFSLQICAVEGATIASIG